MTKLLSTLITLTALTSCATLTGPTTHQVKIDSNITGATVTVEGAGTYTTPTVVSLKGQSSYIVTAEKACYKSNSSSINGEPRILAGVVGNIFNFTGVVGIAIDYFDGAFFKMPQETYINLTLDEDSENAKCKALIKKLEV